MKLELQKKLYKKHPHIFEQKDLPMSQTCMCWGIDTGDGWYDLINCLCFVIDNYMENEQSQAKLEKRKPCDYIQAVQVKEKFGGLRFYINYNLPEISGAISMAEQMSYYICENCGSTETVTQTQGWIKTLCKECLAKEEGVNE